MEETERSRRYETEADYIESDDFARDQCFLEDESQLSPDVFPELSSFPAGAIYRLASQTVAAGEEVLCTRKPEH